MVEKYCRYCGAEIRVPEGRKVTLQKFCSAQCQKIANRERKIAAQREKRAVKKSRKPRKKSGLDFCMKEAERLKISYGQYMARREQM